MRVKLIAILFCLAVMFGCGSKPAENATTTENRDIQFGAKLVF